jgi:hypothetical protein
VFLVLCHIRNELFLLSPVGPDNRDFLTEKLFAIVVQPLGAFKIISRIRLSLRSKQKMPSWDVSRIFLTRVVSSRSLIAKDDATTPIVMKIANQAVAIAIRIGSEFARR